MIGFHNQKHHTTALQFTAKMDVHVEIAEMILQPDGSYTEGKVRRLDSAHSWVQNGALMFRGFMAVANPTMTDTGGTSRTFTVAANALTASMTDGAADNAYGIQVGTSTTAPAATDTALGTLIANGSGSGQLTYAAVVVNAPVAVTNGYRVQVSRLLTNQSGATITINEVGAVVKNQDVAGNFNFLILHDTVAGGYALTNTGTVSFRYLIDFLMLSSGSSSATQVWLQQAALNWYVVWGNAGNTTITDTGGTARTVNATGILAANFFRGNAGVGSVLFGIVVGTGTTTPTSTDTVITTLIANGSGAGQLTYQAESTATVSSIAGGYAFTTSRQTDNNSGGSITVQEIALYVITTDSGSTTRYFAVMHQLTGAVAIANGASETWTLTFNFLV